MSIYIVAHTMMFANVRPLFGCAAYTAALGGATILLPCQAKSETTELQKNEWAFNPIIPEGVYKGLNSNQQQLTLLSCSQQLQRPFLSAVASTNILF